MKATRWVLVLAGAAATAALASGAISFGVTRTVVPPSTETVRTEVVYVPDDRLLSLHCAAASRGLCRIIVDDGGRVRSFALKTGAHATVRGIGPGARTCAGGRDPATACAWTPVG